MNCPTCHGKGFVVRPVMMSFTVEVTCQRCMGTGYVNCCDGDAPSVHEEFLEDNPVVVIPDFELGENGA